MAKSEVMERLIEELDKQKELVSNFDYISWLEKFTLFYERFESDSWNYVSEEISEEDLKNVQNLEHFFYGIIMYYDEHYINFNSDDSSKHELVHIKHNNVGYEIGIVFGQVAYVYVWREEPKKDAIDFSNIVNGIAPENYNVKKSLLEEFETIILKMKEEDIPKTCITEVIDRHY